MSTTQKVRRVQQADADAWEHFRLYQRDVLVECFEDAELLMRRLRIPPTDEDKRKIVEMLWEKRCRAWRDFRDEQRALAALR